MASTEQEIRTGLAEIVNEIAGVPAATSSSDKSFTDDLDIDSLSMVEVVVAAEEKFGVTIPDDDVKNLRTVGDAVAYIAEAGCPEAMTCRPRTSYRRHRARRDHARRRRRRVDLVGPARRAVRRPCPHRGLGRRAAGADRRAGGRRARRGDRPGRGAQARPLRAVRADRRPGGVGRRRLDADDVDRRAARRRGRAPASAASHTLLSNYDVLREKGPRRVSPLAIPMLMPNGPAAYVGLELGARAGVHTPVSACASGAEAIAYGLDMIRNGRADIVVAGGTEAAIHPLPLAAFADMMALSKRNDEPERASRPYDKGRDGFVLGEGAGIVVLESAEHAERARRAHLRRGSPVPGMSADAHHIAQPDPSVPVPTTGDAHRARRRRTSSRPTSRTSTPRHVDAAVGDIAEAVAIRAVLGDASRASRCRRPSR